MINWFKEKLNRKEKTKKKVEKLLKILRESDYYLDDFDVDIYSHFRVHYINNTVGSKWEDLGYFIYNTTDGTARRMYNESYVNRVRDTHASHITTKENQIYQLIRDKDLLKEKLKGFEEELH